MVTDDEEISFSVLLETAISSNVVLSQWCSTMDIVALVTEDGQLQLFRLNWQRLWSITADDLITCICWRPDGKQLAYGTNSGDLVVVSPEDGSVLEEKKIFENGGVCAIDWQIAQHASENPHLGAPLGYRAPKFVHSERVKNELGGQSASLPFRNKIFSEEMAVLRPDGKLSVLTAVSGSGDVAICGDGLQKYSCFKMIQKLKEGSTVRVRMAPSAREISVLWQDEHDALRLSTADTSILADNASTLFKVGSIISDNMRDMNMAYEILWKIQKACKNVEETREAFLEAFVRV